jgi:hypothetical protein
MTDKGGRRVKPGQTRTLKIWWLRDIARMYDGSNVISITKAKKNSRAAQTLKT